MDPLAEYSARRDRFRAEEQFLKKRFVAIGNWRLLVGIVTAVLAWFAIGRRTVSPLWLLPPIAAFVALAVWHSRITRKRTLSSRAIAFYERGIARLNDNWAGKGSLGDQYRSPAHVYADDLDLFGKGGLFDLIAIARTRAGEDTLARWLLKPSPRDEVLLRQSAVDELRPNLDLREDIALLAQDVRSEVNVEKLRSWGAAPPVPFFRLFRPLAILLSVLSVAAVVGFFTAKVALWELAAVIGCDVCVIFVLRNKTNVVLEGVEASGRDLQIFSALASRLEGEQFQSPRLGELRRKLDVAGHPASKRIAKLGRLVDWLDSGDHAVVRIFRPLVLWREQLAEAFERWRAESGSHVGHWLDAVSEIEALSAFASLSFERPDWHFPDLVDTSEALFDATALKHPLLAAATAVPNDLSLDRNQRLLVISGSNMSGKSTLLRAVGLNAVLAWAGAPVAAQSLRVSPLQIGASIRVNDSLQDHKSRFYAEITRVRQVVDLTKNGAPVLFLLDELLSGTNSHDRRIGASGIVRELLRSDTVGLITTHDLALAKIQQDLSEGVLNVHFEDQMQGSEMVFDYKLKPGVVTRSNAIELMRAVGLQV